MALLRDLTIKTFHEGLINKRFSALEIAQAFFGHIKETDPHINAYLSLNEEGALRDAEQVDLAIARDEDVGLLAGVPLAIKDNILIKGLPATAASRMLEDYTASYDATVIQKLKSERAIFLGKVNLDEFAMGASTENSAFRITKNPHDRERVPGGTSGGSAAAVAGHMAVAALGSDTGGSIRQPSGFCGVVGLKPTYGAVSRFGLIAMASSLDQIGPIAKTVEDAAILFGAISGKDPLDATSTEVEYGDELFSSRLEEMKRFTVGLPEEYFIGGLDEGVRMAVDEAIQKIKSLGLRFKRISLPHTKYALACYYIVMPAEVSANLARFDGIRYSRINAEESADKRGIISVNQRLNPRKSALEDIYFKTRGEGLGAEVKRRIILGAFVLSSGYYDAYYLKAQKVRALIKKDFEEAFKEVDVILTPVAPTPAFKIGEKIDDPLAMYLSDIFTASVNLAGLPAISIPVKKYELAKDGLPIGFQLIGKPFREADILGIGRYYERIARL